MGLADVAQSGFDLTAGVVVVVHDDDTGSVAHHHEFCVMLGGTVVTEIDGKFAIPGSAAVGTAAVT